MEHKILVSVKHKKKSAGVEKDVQGQKICYKVISLYLCYFYVYSRWRRGQFLICGFVIVNLVTRFLFFHCHSDPQWSSLERSFRALFQWCLLSESRNTVSLVSARLFLVLFLTLESKIFPVYQVNMSDINNLKFKLRFCSYLRRRFQVKTRCDAEIFGSKQRQAN